MTRLIRWFGFTWALVGCASAPRYPDRTTPPSSEIALKSSHVPGVTGPWIRLVRNPDLGPWSDPGAQPVDFTIWQAADGSWQLVACVRKTKFPGGGRLFFRWESPSLTKADWEEKGIFLTSNDDPAFKQGELQAPHVVKEDDLYHMFFNSSGSAFVWTSRDGKSFARPDPGEVSVALFDMGRDVMVFDNRPRDGFIYAYYTVVIPGSNPGRQDHTIGFRTSRHLVGPWSEQQTIAVLTPDTPGSPYNFINAESPFVVYREGFYYRWEQMNVHASTNPTLWSDGPVARLTGDDPRAFYAPEIVETARQLYVVGYKYKGERAGIYLAPFAFVGRE